MENCSSGCNHEFSFSSSVISLCDKVLRTEALSSKFTVFILLVNNGELPNSPSPSYVHEDLSEDRRCGCGVVIFGCPSLFIGATNNKLRTTDFGLDVVDDDITAAIAMIELQNATLCSIY